MLEYAMRSFCVHEQANYVENIGRQNEIPVIWLIFGIQTQRNYTEFILFLYYFHAPKSML